MPKSKFHPAVARVCLMDAILAGGVLTKIVYCLFCAPPIAGNCMGLHPPSGIVSILVWGMITSGVVKPLPLTRTIELPTHH